MLIDLHAHPIGVEYRHFNQAIGSAHGLHRECGANLFQPLDDCLDIVGMQCKGDFTDCQVRRPLNLG